MKKGIIIIVLLTAAFIGGIFLSESGSKENPLEVLAEKSGCELPN